MDRRLLLIGGGAAAAVGVAALALSGGGEQQAVASGDGAAPKPSGGAATGGFAPQPAADDATVTALQAKGYAVLDVPLGADDAPVTLVEYASTTCPHCANFHNATLPTLKKEYVDAGKLKLVMREVYFDQPGLWSSLIARAGGPERYHAFMDVIFQRQAAWARGGQQQVLANLRQIGRLGGLSAERIDGALNDTAFINFMLGRYQKESNADGVRSTPHFIIGGEPVTGNQPIDVFRRAIDKKLGA